MENQKLYSYYNLHLMIMKAEDGLRLMDIIGKITDELGIRRQQTEAAVKLIDEGNTIPFIARYRKEATGSLNDEALRNLSERLIYLRGLEERKAAVIESIDAQGKLTEELKNKIEGAETLVAVDDLYLPYRPKRRTRAGIAKEKGLEPLAYIIMMQKTDGSLEDIAGSYVDQEKGVCSVEEALDGAKDIIAEAISDNAEYRTYIRNITFDEGILKSTAKDEKVESVYEMYYAYEEPVRKAAGYRILALNRGEKEKFLSVSVEAPEERIIIYLEKKTISSGAASLQGNCTPSGAALLQGNRTTSGTAATQGTTAAVLMQEAVKDSYERLIAPAIERDIRNELTEKAQDGAINVFGKNLKQLLMQPPVAGQTVLGWDPAFRTGCKLAVVDETGKVLDTKVIFPTAPQNKVEESKKILKEMIKKYHVSLISVGNGTASRESEQVIAELIKELDTPVKYVIVNEAGASVYSASKLATEEFPQFDVGQRSAASIARRIQDPLAELVKIDPESIGVGQYQHDMDQKKLAESLSGVVEECVNSVGVDLNTSSAPLLGYISGITKTTAKNIVDYREKNGRFRDRRQLLKVPKLGPKAYEQCAGFLRIRGGDNPLDNTSVHPESYSAAEKLMKKFSFTMDDVKNAQSGRGVELLSNKIKGCDEKKLADELGIGVITLADVAGELEKPSRDPRENMAAPVLRSDVMDMKDLKPGMILKGTVRNVIDFGAFVDIGVHQDGLVHISQMSDRYIKHPLEVVSVGDVVTVQVISVDEAKKRIALTMKIKG